MCCPLVFEFSVGIGGFVIGLGQISFFCSLHILSNEQCFYRLVVNMHCLKALITKQVI